MITSQKPTQVVVITTNLATGESTSRTIDHNDPVDRKWLGRHSYWAMRNGRELTTRPLQ